MTFQTGGGSQANDMLKIGYVRLRDVDPTTDTATLKALGCHVVRAEEAVEPDGDNYAVLNSILDFIWEGDQLVVTSLSYLAPNGRGVLEVLDRLEARNASLYITTSQLGSQGVDGRALRAALQAVAALEPANAPRRRRPAATEQIRDMQQAGVGPVEIARRLGVSRMTVWRKLKALEAQS